LNAPPGAGNRWGLDALVDRPVRVVVLGRQGSGKGTQSERLAARFALVHLSTGAVFREAVALESDLGRAVNDAMQAGDLVPDELATRVVADSLARPDVRRHGFVLDGFPRTVQQAETLARLVGEAVDAAINLAVHPRAALERMLRRRVCANCGRAVQSTVRSGTERCRDCGGPLVRRADDTPSSIMRRLTLFEQQTKPLLGWYARRGVLATVDGHGSPDEVALRVERALASWLDTRISLSGSDVDKNLTAPLPVASRAMQIGA
jgi:adenylate kinase